MWQPPQPSSGDGHSPSYLPLPTPPRLPNGSGDGNNNGSPRPDPNQGAGYLDRLRATRTLIHIPTEQPRWTIGILAVLVAVFVVEVALGGSLDFLPNASTDWLSLHFAKINALIAFDGQWWLMITAIFLHSGLLHIASNGYALYIIGLDTEAFFGRLRFLAIFAVSGIGGSVASFALSPFDVPGVGASGAIFGLIGALAVYFGLHRRLFGKRGTLQFWNIIFVVILNLGLGFSGLLPIDNSAHLGGLVTGALLGYILCPRYSLGNLEAPNIRSLVDNNRGRLPWIATGVVTLIVVALFFVVLLMYTQGYKEPLCKIVKQAYCNADFFKQNPDFYIRAIQQANP